jgi:putative membrane protein
MTSSNLKMALLAFAFSACISTMPAQNTPAKPVGDKTHAGEHSATSEAMVNPMDQKFMTQTAQSGMMEVQLAQLALQKAASQEVKDYARQLEQDHSKANDELKTLAQQKNINLPADMGTKHQSHMTKFQNMSAEQFDREYIKTMAGNHRNSIREFQKQADRAMDSHVKEFAAKTLPTLQTHLQRAQELQTSTRSRKADTKSNTNNSNDSTRTPGGENNPTPRP